MDWGGQATEREFDCFAAEVSDPLLRAGHLMTGDANDAEDLVQETLLRVAWRWKRVRFMEHPAAYARRVLVNLVLHDAGRRDRRLAAAITAAAAAAVLGLGLTGVFGPAPAGHRGTIQTIAFTLVKHANGTATLTINPDGLLEPATLQSDLRHDGIPAMVTTGRFCSSEPSPPGFTRVVTGQDSSPDTMTINPAAIAAGTELSFGYFQLSSGGQETATALINTSSYTCATTAPAAPPGGGDMLVHQLSCPPSESCPSPKVIRR